MDYRLGCGTYRVMVQRRCGSGSRFVCELQDTQSISYNRILNEVSEATITVSMDGCCGCLSDVNPWEHELAIFRNESLVWVGPIVDLEFKAKDGVIDVLAKDLLSWADRRLIELADTDYEPEATDLADAYTWILNHAYCKDPWCMTWSIDPVGIPIQRFYPSFDKAGGERWGGQYPNCGDEMRTLAESGVDFTVINRHLWGGNIEVSNPVSTNVILLDEHFQTTPDIKVSGSKMVTRQVSAGGDGGYSGFYDDQVAIYPGTLGPITSSLLDASQQKFGLLEAFNTTPIYDEVDTTIIPNPVLQDAKTRWDLLHEPYVFISGGDLDPSAPLTFEETLIPGAIIGIGLRNTCRDLTENQMRLREVQVSVSESGETVSIDLTPLGTQDIGA